MRKNLFLVSLALVVFAIAGTFMLSRPVPVRASDHDDGETDIKTRNLNLTDVYAFREDDQESGAGATGNLIIAVNTNPRSLPRQQYFFNTKATYTVHLVDAGVGNATNDNVVNNPITGNDTLDFNFTFGTPTAATGAQAFTLNVVNVAAGTTSGPFNGNITPCPPGTLGNKAGAPTVVTNTFNNVALGNGGAASTVSVFAGLREDPFFFDVTQFFRVRAFALGDGPAPPVTTGGNPFRNGGPTVNAAGGNNAVDFTKDYNVNAIVMRVPIAALGTKNTDTLFDVWATIQLPQ
ncbi:MAG: DUF4331 family protein [Candidatus Xenobia bacterium]